MALDMNTAYELLTAKPGTRQAGYQPNPMQAAVWRQIENGDLGTALLLKSVTGSGKTEAVSVPAISQNRRLIMVYPTRSLVDDQIDRFTDMLINWSRHTNKTTSLVIDTGAQSIRRQWKNGQALKAPPNPRRHLYHGDVIITTLDKFLYRFFGFGESQKGYTFPLRIAYGLHQPLICFDEAHSYDDAAFTNFQRLVRTLYDRGRDLVLMTATMSAAHEACFDYLTVVDFAGNPANTAVLSHWQKQQHATQPYSPHKTLRHFPESIQLTGETTLSPAIEKIIELAQTHAAPARRLIVVVESVKEAAAVFERLRQTVPADTPVQLYHGRLAHEQRSKVYQGISARDKNGGYILITTSAIEVGCDLDAHILITQLCDPDRLVQRAGRCNRRQTIANAQVIVVGDNLPEWMTTLPETQRPNYVAAIAAQDGMVFAPQPLLEQFFQPNTNLDPQVETMFDMLYEYVYEAKLVNKKLHENGLVITRSWEPTLTLYRGQKANGKGLNDAVTVPMSRCRIPKDGQPMLFLAGFGEGICRQVYDQQEKKFVLKPLAAWENGYNVDILVDLSVGYDYDPELGYVELPALFHGPFRAGAKRLLQHIEGETKHTIWYLDPQDTASKPFAQFLAGAPSEDMESDAADSADNEGDDDE